MKPWRKPIAGLAFVAITLVLIGLLPLSSLAAPQGLLGTPSFLPLVISNRLATDTPTATATSTSTATPTTTVTPSATSTATLTATPTATPITPTIPITVAPSGLHVFSPISITISAGATVRWTWDGSFHTVTSGTYPNADNVFCSPSNNNCSSANTSNSGATYEFTFNTPGTYNYFCQIHGGSGMVGTIVVKP